METPYDIDAELVANRIADRVVKGGVLVEAIKGVVKVEIRESFEGEPFANAVRTEINDAFESETFTNAVRTEINDAFKGETFASAVRTEVNESYQSPEFSEAVGAIVETKVTKVFDNHMGELKEALQAINNRLSKLENP